MHISVTGDPEVLRDLFQEAIRAIYDEGSYSFQLDDDTGRTLTVDFEGTDKGDVPMWETM